MMESYVGYVLMALVFVAFLFVFFWATPANEEEAKKR